MLDPTVLASTILSDPENAVCLFQLIVWMRGNRGDPAHEAAIDALEEYAYSKTELCAKHREVDRRSFLMEVATSADSSGAEM